MDTQPKTAVQLDKFGGGVFSDADSMDVPPGNTWRQVNLLSIRNGELTTRAGLRELDLDTLE